MYYILYGFLYLLSLLPFWVLYGISDFFYFLVYYVIKYRRQVTMSNLAIGFPEKTEKERQQIAKQFYRNFTDNFIESIKLLSISQKQLNKHFTSDYDVINDLYASGQSIQIHLGHQFNWEFAWAAHAINVKYKLIGVYMPIKSQPVDRLFKHLRTRFNTIILPATNFRTSFHPYLKIQYGLGLIADQSPGDPAAAYWVDFFGRKTPFVKGPEKGALLNNTAIVFTSFTKIKRGHYHAYSELFTTTPRALANGEITSGMAKFIEVSVRKDPANYLWTHRRWKHAFEERYRHNVVQ